MRKFVTFYTILAILAAAACCSLMGDNASAYSKNDQIGDEVFGNYKSMSESQINNFIKAFPNSCLKSQNYPSGLSPVTFKEPLSYFDYGGNTTPGRIIWKASQLYKINPQVLLTTLEKEQNLVSGNAGCAVWKYNSAMGYNCPDGSENNLKNYPSIKIYNTCVAKESNAGFSRQVNRAAWQLSFDAHRADGDLAWMGDGDTPYYGRMTQGMRARVNGGSVTYYDGYYIINGEEVFMSNGPTAALYNYTPHFSNFSAIFTQWFGSTHYTLQGKIGARYTEIGGKSKIGSPISGEITLSTGGKYQKFQKGRIYWKKATGAWEVVGSIGNRYLDVKADVSALGYPTSAEKTAGAFKYQQYEGGRIYWSKSTGARSVYGRIGDRYADMKSHAGRLGYPLTNEIKLSTGGAYQEFQRGRIYWTKTTGAWDIGGKIGARYVQTGGSGSNLGYPTSGEKSEAGYKYQQYQGGRIYWNKSVGANRVVGKIGVRYLAEPGRVGYPISEEAGISTGGRYQQFTKGRIYWKKDTGAWDVGGRIGSSYINARGSGSPLGYPTGSEVAIAGGKYQEYEGGRIYWKSGESKAFLLYGKIGARYEAVNANESHLGYPTSNEISLSTGGRYQQFEHGRIYWKKTTGAWNIGGKIGSLYYSLGGSGSRLGYPTSSETKLSDRIVQQFQKGTITYKDKKATYKYN